MRVPGVWILVAGALAAGTLTAQDDDGMQEWMAMNQPGEMHKLLDALVGSFEAVSEMPSAPDAPPSKGQCDNSWQLDGRFVESRYSANFMGMPFAGIGYMGYDNMNGQFIHMWMDNLSLQMLSSKGTISEDHKTITLQGSMGAAGAEEVFKFVYEIESRDKHTFKMYSVVDGTDAHTMTVTYTRRKKPAPGQ